MTMMHEVRLIAALLSFGSGAAACHDDAAEYDFQDVSCLPDPAQTPAVAGMNVTCSFRVEGKAAGPVTLSCEDPEGDPFDCGATSRTQLQPFGANALPILSGYFAIDTEGFAGSQRSVVWVASDGNTQARRRFDVQVVADDGLNQVPAIAIDCGAGAVAGEVEVSAGAELSCRLEFVDPDPGNLTWSYRVTSGGAVPAREPAPFGGAGLAPVQLDWRWSTDASESNTRWVFEFSVSDGVGASSEKDLVVQVR